MVRTIDAFDRLREENALGVQARVAELTAQGRDIVDLAIGRPTCATPEHIMEAAVRALRDGQDDSYGGHGDPTGIAPLREAVAADVARRTGVTIPADRVMIVPGPKVTLLAAILLFGGPGVDILYPDPGAPTYRSLIEFTGARAVPVPIRERNGFALAATELLSLITPATRLVIVNSPADPTGGVTSQAEANRLVAGLLDHPGVAVLSDEVHDRLTYGGAAHVSMLGYPEIRNRLIVSNGWSRAYGMSGWQLGWSIWPTTLTDRVRRFAVNGWGSVNTAAQHAGIAALEGPQGCVDDLVAELDRCRRLTVRLLSSLPGVSCVPPLGACYAFPNITGTGWSSDGLASILLEQAGVAVLGGPGFGDGGVGYLRVGFAAGEARIREAMNRIGEFLVEHEAAVR